MALDVQYVYDTFDRLVSRTVLNASGSGGAALTQFVDDGSHVMLQDDGREIE